MGALKNAQYARAIVTVMDNALNLELIKLMACLYDIEIPVKGGEIVTKLLKIIRGILGTSTYLMVLSLIQTEVLAAEEEGGAGKRERVFTKIKRWRDAHCKKLPDWLINLLIEFAVAQIQAAVQKEIAKEVKKAAGEEGPGEEGPGVEKNP